MSIPLIECVPNFSEGNDLNIIRAITAEIESVEGVRLLDTDPGKATNRTVVTFVGNPDSVITAAFCAIKKSAELIDMRTHKGEHARMGATDVCPLIPISGITMDETVVFAKKLAERVGKELHIPVYLYESAATKPERKNLATIREGEYEGLQAKLKNPEWKPDFGPAEFNAKNGATVIGVRDFLVAYNVNLNTTSVRRANSVAFDVREAGRVLREGDPVTGKIKKDEKGEPIRIPGTLKSVKAVGWYIQEYGIAQVSLNLTNLSVTPVHIAFEEVCKKALERGIRATGSELVGLIPLKSMTDSGKYFLKKQQRSAGISEEELVHIAIRSLGLNDITPFNPDKKIIEYVIRDTKEKKLVDLNLKQFANETASESPAPGGGSIAAYVGSLGASLGTMVANLSSHKRGWDERWEEFSGWAEKGQWLKDELLRLVDDDTQAFNQVMDAFGLPKGTEEEKKIRALKIEEATKQAISVPLNVMKKSYKCLELLKYMAEKGNPNSASDAGVGILCAMTAIRGAWLNVKINIPGLKDKEFSENVLSEGQKVLEAGLREGEEALRGMEGRV
ncbi:MAG: glutamate formimidoyltransferase [Bacteroidetes bacterium RIFCSPLOWO2_02_FULL_36_8]|nr:MAG: glutamate formimidoyltransferase [Bacteroidetes bacterium RIFCSPLOWO2_02_FULL_36_8]OFY69660.1 MAG: glutamate formimidoyltransferase [Bacteroidetes bacterium RIFCSPLOWO2_12_FULL_37_12]